MIFIHGIALSEDYAIMQAGRVRCNANNLSYKKRPSLDFSLSGILINASSIL